jgi:hypothetical protein
VGLGVGGGERVIDRRVGAVLEQEAVADLAGIQVEADDLAAVVDGVGAALPGGAGDLEGGVAAPVEQDLGERLRGVVAVPLPDTSTWAGVPPLGVVKRGRWAAVVRRTVTRSCSSCSQLSSDLTAGWTLLLSRPSMIDSSGHMVENANKLLNRRLLY